MKCKILLYNLLPDIFKRWYLLKKSKEYPIIKKPNSILNVAKQAKGHTWEKTYYAPLYGHCKEQCLEVTHPIQSMYFENNVIVNTDSDIIITDKGVFWDKYNTEEFVTWAKPADSNLLSFDRNIIRVIRHNKPIHIEGTSLFLAGNWTNVWSHFILQNLCKLFVAGENGILDENINILMHKREDRNIIEIVTEYLKKYTNTKIVYLEPYTDYVCDKLYFMPSTYTNYDEYRFRLDYTDVMPQCYIDMIDQYVVKPLINKIKDRKALHTKIFIGRKGAKRNLTNYEEIHNYFISQGFVDIEGSSLSIEEKANIFYHAKEIVGLYGSATQNFIFCNNANCLIFTNYRMSTDPCLYTQARRYVRKWINVSGYDENSEYHSNYTISLDKVKEAYTKHIKL